jgi:hypothetical protein
MAAYGDTGSMAAYEYDHLVPLELGGATNDPRNLWPQPGASPNPKDAVEDELRAAVCDGRLSLAQAQRAIAHDWVSAASGSSAAEVAPPPAAPAAGGAAATCTATAAYNSRYGDYDVYVHSNQPNRTVTVSDAAGNARSWHTDSSGYADVYFRAAGDATGTAVTVEAGAASCTTSL